MKGFAAFLRMLVFLAVAAVNLGACRPGADKGPANVADQEPVSGSDAVPVSFTNIDDLSKYGIRYYKRTDADTAGGTAGASASVLETDEPFVVASVGPEDVIPSEVRRPSMYFVFSQPVVPLAALGKPEGKPDFIRVDPPIAGVFRWYGTRLLSFDTSENIIPQQAYTFTIGDTLRSLGGKPLTGDRVFTFRTEYLSLSDWYPGDGSERPELDDVPLNQATRITLVFNYPVNPEVIKDYIGITALNSSVPFTAGRPENPENRIPQEELDRTVVLQLEVLFQPQTDITVEIREGARSEKNLLGIPEPIRFSFSTLKPFTFVEHSTSSYVFPYDGKSANAVFFEFSHPVDPETVLGAVRTIPRMPVQPANIAVWDRTVRLEGLPVAFESTYRVQFSEALKDIYGLSLSGTADVAVEVGPAVRYAHFPNTGTRMLEAAFPPKIVFEFQNVFDGVWKIGKIDDPYTKFSRTQLVPYDSSGIKKNVRHFEVLDLSPYLNTDKKGMVGISWNFAPKQKDGTRPEWNQANLQLQVTDLGLTTRYAYNRVIALVSSLSSGAPVPGAKVSLLSDRKVVKTATTDKEGLAAFGLEAGEYSRLFGDPKDEWRDRLRFRVEKAGDRIEFEPNQSHNIWHFGIYSYSSPVQAGKVTAATYVFTDRGLYRPGEEVTFRGIDRDQAAGEYRPFTGRYTVNLREPGYEGKTLGTVSGTTTASGGYFGSFTLPENAAPGYYTLEYLRAGNTVHSMFQVANFERIAFSVRVRKPEILSFSGDTLRFGVSASYLSGGPLAGGKYSAYWTKEPAYFRPEGEEWTQYVFGPELPGERMLVSETSGVLGADGSASISQDTSASGVAGLAYRYRLETEVSDVSRRQVASRADAVVHPASLYIGAKLAAGKDGWWSPFVKKGDQVELDFALVAPDGSLYSGQKNQRMLKVELYREDWKLAQQRGVAGRINTRWERVEELESSQEGRVSGSRGKATVSPQKAGSYFVKLTTRDEEGREAVTKLSFYATGSDWIRWAEEGSTDIGLTAEKSVYSPGETARILMKTPLPEGRYLVTVEREGILDERLVSVKGSTQILEVPIEERYLPVVYVAVSSYSVRTGKPVNTYFEPDLDKPKGYFGIVPVTVETASRVIDLKVVPTKAVYRPGEEAEVTVTASLGGKAAPGVEITFMAVDRGVVDIIDYHVQDPALFFYSPERFPLGVAGADSRSLLIDPVTYEVKDLQGGDSESGKMEERKDFRPTAVFVPFLTTGPDGGVKVKFTLPDTLTTYRLTAVAVKENAFGLEEEELQTRNPINVNSAVPGTFRERDTVFAGVIMTNLDASPRKVTVSAESDLLNVEGETSVQVELQPGSTVNLPFQLSAPSVGKGLVTFTVDSEILSEKVVSRVEVVTPRVFETFATIGKVTASEKDDGKAGFAEEGFVIPSGTPPELSSLSVTMNSTRLASLKGAIEYLLQYPYGCFEQRASRMMPLVVFAEDLPGLRLSAMTADVKKTVTDELALWGGFQNRDGGYPFWPGSGVSSYYGTLRIAHVLALAAQYGYPIPASINMKTLVSYLEKKTERLTTGERMESGTVSPYHRSYAVYVRSLLASYGNRSAIRDEADRLVRTGDALGIAGYGYLGLAYHELRLPDRAKDMLSRMKRFVRPGTQSIDITETAESGEFFNSEVERLSLLLMLWIRLEPGNDMVTRIYTTLQLRQKGGYWKNTADTNWAVLASADLYRQEKEVPADFQAGLTAGGSALLSGKLQGTASEALKGTWKFDSPELSGLARDSLQPLRFEARGTGTLYYTAALQYAVPPEIAPARDQGLGIYTEIFDLSGNRLEDRMLKPGETYRVIAHVSSPKRRNFVAVRLPVPSGAEILDASFVTTSRRGFENFSREGSGEEQEDTEENRGEYVPPVRQEILKGEVRFFIDDFPQGNREFEFLFRTVVSGVFPTPPSTAECMYEPEVFGRTEGNLVFIDTAR